MAATKLKMEMYRGDDKRFRVAVIDPDNDNAPVDLSTIETMRFTAKLTEFVTDSNATIRKSVGDGITITDAIGGIAVIKIDPEDTSTLKATIDLVADIQVVDGASETKTIAKGVLKVISDITRTSP